jgi:hypothetical protein
MCTVQSQSLSDNPLEDLLTPVDLIQRDQSMRAESATA